MISGFEQTKILMLQVIPENVQTTKEVAVQNPTESFGYASVVFDYIIHSMRFNIFTFIIVYMINIWA